MSFLFGLSHLQPHFLQHFTPILFLALHFLQIAILEIIASASANFPINTPKLNTRQSIIIQIYKHDVNTVYLAALVAQWQSACRLFLFLERKEKPWKKKRMRDARTDPYCLRSSVVERLSCKQEVESSNLSGGLNDNAALFFWGEALSATRRVVEPSPAGEANLFAEKKGLFKSQRGLIL